ncbi:probable 28S ribosomal protein S10, mitochondrial isoform X1 [Salvelinus namaycush]|uniref:Small ribosomal subunit protein uS10m n=1 Tax=Salvelinus namaycush TaxID=8040 RepID=A0A8U0P5T7_SALNM|nr:probable 28S ribosomal protein S10, mitochondrial isoform X1 [Salvelinus namaycush]
MAAPVVIGRNIRTFGRIFVGVSQSSLQGSIGLNACRYHGRSTLFRPLQLPAACLHTGTFSSSLPSSVIVTEEPDTLYQKVSVLVKGHDKAVLDSYEFFAILAAKELGVTLGKVFEPPKNIERLTLLKSVHIFKKHRVQYEMRTHYRCIELSRVTGSTAQVYLEYIQRNLPEGVAMEVTKTSMEKVPEHILEPMWNDPPTEEKPSHIHKLLISAPNQDDRTSSPETGPENMLVDNGQPEQGAA